jgi:Flp pilus assembly protein TadG
MPVLILLVLTPIQIGLWWHAKQAAETAAEEALDAAQVSGATASEGQAGAHAILDRAGNLRDVTIAVDRGAETVTVEVSGTLGFSIFPGSWGVTARAAGPVEEFIPEPER